VVTICGAGTPVKRPLMKRQELLRRLQYFENIINLIKKIKKGHENA